jgi:hypothetical protein
MAKNANPPRFEDHQGLIHLQAQQCLKMANLNHAGFEYDDCFQEASIAFLKAAENYDPESGFKFSAIYSRYARNHFQKVIGVMSGVKNLNTGQREQIQLVRDENKRRAIAGEKLLDPPQWGLRPVPFSRLRSHEEGLPFEELLEADSESPEQKVERLEWVDKQLQRMSPLTQLVVSWLREPPPELVCELGKQSAHYQHAKEQGARAATNMRDPDVSIDSIGRFLQLAGAPVDDTDLALVHAELGELVRQVETA